MPLGLLSLVILTVLVIYYDLSFRLIPNWLSIAILFASCVFFGAKSLGYLTFLSLSLYCLFYFKVIGGGDVKLALAYFIAIDSNLYTDVILLILTLGGILGFICCVALKLSGTASIRTYNLPYGIPIGLSGFLGIVASI
ncbi:prepilin peptidase [Vibrio agarivorans]|uniref:Prepilin type IV endopeptidase peptidase domain-containing protein n=1 Tax=Vibrio agarivorans TaxID=153622 RepID=A0ABT7Y6P9_9VIBR|nr:prepilin peptidase [Vibrio agarivorans]MDN2483733.1 hypothetical protein [Vibrio agarivorans]